VNRRQIVSAAAVLMLIPSLTWGAGFALFEHGNRAMAMGGAFTAVADDPSAVFWNPAGIAFQLDKGRQVMNGFTLITASQTFYGQSPYPGDGYMAEQESQVFYPPHLFLIMPMTDSASVNFGFNTPFGLGTWWDDNHAGRFISKRVDLKLFNAMLSFSFKLGDRFAGAIGADYAVGQIDLTRNIPFMNPFTQSVADIGQVHLHTNDLNNRGWGWHYAMMFKVGKGISIGGLYRSTIEVDYKGVGSFTQFPTGYPELDAAAAAALPFGQKVALRTRIEFPDYWALGVAWTHEQWTVSAQYGRMGWSVFDELPMQFPDHPHLSDVVEEHYSDADQYRLGVEYRASDKWAFQGGVLYDNTPQPITTMTPLLGDGDRTGISLGISMIHGKLRSDIGYMYLMFEDRSTNGMQLDGYDGRYDTMAHLVGATLSMKF
jgi:long-chain fatty acid transport protein